MADSAMVITWMQLQTTQVTASRTQITDDHIIDDDLLYDCRADFEALASDFFARAAVPLKDILARNEVAITDLSAVELLGGGSRVPAVKKALSEAMGARQLDM